MVKVISRSLEVRISGISLDAPSPSNPQKAIHVNIIERNEIKPEKRGKRVQKLDENPDIMCAKRFSCSLIPGTIRARITRNNDNAVPSLRRLSPSKINVSLRGAPISLKRASTETGSVADMSVQKSKRKRKGILIPKKPRIQYSIPAMTNADIMREMTASPEMARICCMSSLYFML